MILKDDIDIFEESTNSKEPFRKVKKEVTLKNAIILFNVRKKFLMLLKVKYFQMENKEKDSQVI